MILTIDIGNTNIVVGAFSGDKIAFSARMNTDKNKLMDEYAIDIKDLFSLYGMNRPITGAIISSVVPKLTGVISKAIKLVFGLEALVVGPGIKTGLNIKIDNPSQLGSDIMANAVAAYTSYKPPIVIFDMGTATTISVIDEQGNILGGAIMPGVRISLDALSQKAAQLPEISLEDPKDIIGTNTIDSMKSGIVYGTASMIDGVVDRMAERLGKLPTVVATGGLSGIVVPYCRHEIIINSDLQLQGLLELYHKNKR